MTPEIIESLEQSIADLADERLVVPRLPSGTILVLDVDGDEAADATNDGIDPSTEPSSDGLATFTAVVPGDYELATMGTPAAAACSIWNRQSRFAPNNPCCWKTSVVLARSRRKKSCHH